MVTFAASELALQRAVVATFKLRCFAQVVATTLRLRKERLLHKNAGSEPRGYHYFVQKLVDKFFGIQKIF